MRALRTPTRLHPRNFAPDRWPAGDPARRPVDTAKLTNDLFAAFADIDPGPTKAWLVMHRDDPAVLHDLADDPDHLALAALLDRRLLRELEATGDPRVLGRGDVFDRYPTHSDPGYGRPDDF